MKYLSLICLCFLLLTDIKADPENVDFFSGNLSSVQKKAKEEGKLYFIDFVADYCYLCDLMDETTFSDQNLSNYIEGSYVPYKVDVNSFDGYNLKKEFNIKSLPTIMIFSSDGKVLARHQGSMGVKKMMSELKNYDKPQYRGKGRTTTSQLITNNTTTTTAPTKVNRTNIPPPTKYEVPTTATTSTNNAVVPEPVTKYNGSTFPSRTTTTSTTTKPNTSPPGRNTTQTPPPKKRLPKQYTTETTPPKKEETPVKIVPSPPQKVDLPKPQTTTQTKPPMEGLFEFSVKKHKYLGFGVQIGVFAEYGNVLMEVEKLEKQFNKPVLVNINTLKGKTVYKVIVGAFSSRTEAIAFRNVMKKNGVEGFIADLSVLK